jgi:hypothetical protein
MNGSSHPNHENHQTMKFQDGSPPQGLSEALRGSAVFANMLIDTDPPRGRSVGGGGVHRKYLRGINIPLLRSV